MTLLFPITDIFTGEISCKYKSTYGYSIGCRCTDCKRQQYDKINRSRILVREIYDQIRNSHNCFDCERTDISTILHFHHLTKNENDKKPKDCTTLGQMIRELKKGIFLCPTCHTLRHVDPVTGLVRMDISDFR